jgi:ATP-dependent protease HslVU (ClpYQ) ATPase subunit
MTTPSPRDFISTLRGRMPWREKLRLLLKNNLRKLKNMQNCCGHPGEPGC